ncbi:MAG TPA: hypothetical protein VJZ71_16950 [Phycisphaerae bacterium]|nr:hypothetical protein [Phycisphaerae bacterium]
MKSQRLSRVGKGSALSVLAALFAASGQACPPEMPNAGSLPGLWTGSISGDVTLNTLLNMPDPPNPNSQTSESTVHITREVQIVFDPAGRPTTLPLVNSAFGTSLDVQVVTAFNPGETQTITSTTTVTSPTGATDTVTSEQTNSTTLTVTESILTADHFRVVYSTAATTMFSTTGTAVGFMPSSQLFSSTGTLTYDAMATGGHVVFSMDFNNTGTVEFESMGVMTTGNGFSVGSLSGTLAAD